MESESDFGNIFGPLWEDCFGLYDDVASLRPVLHHLARGVSITENDQALDAIHEVGPGGHYLGCAHTQANFKEAFWRTEVLDYKPFETWEEEGAKDSMNLAALRVEQMLANYQKPTLSSDVSEAKS